MELSLDYRPAPSFLKFRDKIIFLKRKMILQIDKSKRNTVNPRCTLAHTSLGSDNSFYEVRLLHFALPYFAHTSQDIS